MKTMLKSAFFIVTLGIHSLHGMSAPSASSSHEEPRAKKARLARELVEAKYPRTAPAAELAAKQGHTTLLIPGHIMPDSGYESPITIELNLDGHDPMTHETFGEILQNPHGALLSVISYLSKSTNRLVYRTYKASSIINKDIDLIAKEPILQRFYFLKSSETQPLTYLEQSLNQKYFLSKLAKAIEGNANEQYMIGLRYLHGKGVEKNSAQAYVWITKAALQGCPDALYKLATCYQDGAGINQDLEKAFTLFEEAAEHGVENARYKIALCYLDGKGTQANSQKGLALLEKLAAKDHACAQFHLASCYRDGKNIEKDLHQAFYWYNEAAKNGNPHALYALALCHEHGYGTDQNLQRAFSYCKRAADAPIRDEEEDDSDSDNDRREKIAEDYDRTDAQYLLGIYCHNGIGTEKDNAASIRCFERAAAHGHAHAQRVMHELNAALGSVHQII